MSYFQPNLVIHQFDILFPCHIPLIYIVSTIILFDRWHTEDRKVSTFLLNHPLSDITVADIEFTPVLMNILENELGCQPKLRTKPVFNNNERSD